MSTVNQQFDVIISGGGMVGASLAHALNGYGLSIAVIEPVMPKDATQPSYDDRAIALSYGSKCILESIGIWSELANHAEAISRIHVSEQGQFGFARLDAREENVEALGFVVTAKDLGHALFSSLSDCEDVSLFCPATLKSFQINETGIEVLIDDAVTNGKETQQTLQGKLLIAADGGFSRIRQQLDIAVKEVDYGQTAIVANVSTQQPHDNVAYERFTSTGPVALLPMTNKRSALVYTVPTEKAADALAMSDEDFLIALQQRFGYRLGRMQKIGERFSYELKLKEVTEHVKPRIALVGNAAHTVHPVAGQGFNLGIRDVAVIAEQIIQASKAGMDPGSMSVLEQYAAQRRKDQQSVMKATDTMVRLFSNEWLPVKLARNLGILSVDMLPGVRHTLSRFAMGMAGRQSRLSRGLRLG